MNIWLNENVVVFGERYLPRIFNRFAVDYLLTSLTSHGMRGYSYLIPSGLPGL